MSYSQILFDAAEDGIATITINRPQKLNALNAGVMRELDAAVGEVERSDSLRGLILTGAGGKAFVAGADIQELAALNPVQAQRLSLLGQAVFRRIERMPKPSIAAVNGFALGGGLELAMSCSLRTASAHARFGQPEVKLGVIPGYGATQRLPRLVGRGRALEMLLTGEPVDADQALRIGLVNHVVQPDELMEFTRALLRRILANAPVALGLALEAVDIGLNCGLEEGLRFEAAAFAVTASTADKEDGTRAFLEKRAPLFTGK